MKMATGGCVRAKRNLKSMGLTGFRLVATSARLLVYVGACIAPLAPVAADSVGGDSRSQVPAWMFPIVPAASGKPAAAVSTEPLHVPNSSVGLTQAQLENKFSAPDWRPHSHPAMPEIVAHGRAPEVFACGYCHSPSGQGRPENASLAQLPAAYIVQQMAYFKAGVRHSASATYGPAAGMAKLAAAANSEEVAAAAEYFSHQTLRPRVKVFESATVPRTTVVGYVYVAIPGAADEPIGERVIEVAPDGERHEKRDDELRYTAYVPPGSVSRGRAMATTVGSNALACVACHGDKLQGVGLVPPLAGRSPTYILRQLLAFQTGARAGETAKPMLAVVAPLHMGDMIDAAAYAASLSPLSP
ncbi:MAG TPA: hypothetical protein VGN07_16575 [Steroidobacteraceae bacterium]